MKLRPQLSRWARPSSAQKHVRDTFQLSRGTRLGHVPAQPRDTSRTIIKTNPSIRPCMASNLLPCAWSTWGGMAEIERAGKAGLVGLVVGGAQ